jgi:hypothetical protein
MAWYAKIENNKVVEVTFLVDTLDNGWLYREFGGTWLKCDEQGTIRNIFPAVGFTYDKEEDAFYPPQPFASWTYDEAKKYWVPPVAYPTDGKEYTWNEDAINWVESPAEGAE